VPTGGMIVRGETELFGGKLIPLSLCPAEIPHILAGIEPGFLGKRLATNSLNHARPTRCQT